jgi:murein DD-endopeptidase MepM/ murein hydrolase activator NlpD
MVQATPTTSAPVITTNPSNQAVNAGQVATFSAAAGGAPTPTPQWQVSTNGGSTFSNISGATSTTYSVVPTASQNGYRYRTVFTNSAGSATTTVAILTVNVANSAPVITTNPSNQTVTAGQVATFVAAASGTPTPTVQWQVSTNGGSTFSNIPAATSTTYSVTATASQNGYRYRAIFTNSVGSATTTVTMLTVTPASARTVTVNYQPTPYPSSIINGVHILDGWLPSMYYGKTFQKDDKLQIGGWGDNYRAYLQFDLKGLPRNVSEATLMLYAYSPGGTSTKVNFNIQSPNTSWIDPSGKLTTSMTWVTQPTGFSNVGSYPPGAYDSWWPMQITQTYNAWLGGSPNNGLAFFSVAQNNNFNVWRSSRYASDAYRPILRLTFTPPVTVPDFKMPLPRNVSWLVTTEAGGWDCKGSAQDTAHADNNYFSIDFAWRNKNASGAQVYPMPSPGSSKIPISPAADGRVVEVGTNSLNGNYVVVSHDPSHDVATGFSTRYLHLDSVLVNKDADVYRDTSTLGYMGTTGQSTGPHLHWGMRYNNDGSATSNVMYAVVSGWLMKSFQSECSTTSDGKPIDWNRYYLSQ